MSLVELYPFSVSTQQNNLANKKRMSSKFHSLDFYNFLCGIGVGKKRILTQSFFQQKCLSEVWAQSVCLILFYEGRGV